MIMMLTKKTQRNNVTRYVRPYVEDSIVLVVGVPIRISIDAICECLVSAN